MDKAASFSVGERVMMLKACDTEEIGDGWEFVIFEVGDFISCFGADVNIRKIHGYSVASGEGLEDIEIERPITGERVAEIVADMRPEFVEGGGAFDVGGLDAMDGDVFGGEFAAGVDQVILTIDRLACLEYDDAEGAGAILRVIGRLEVNGHENAAEEARRRASQGAASTWVLDYQDNANYKKDYYCHCHSWDYIIFCGLGVRGKI